MKRQSWNVEPRPLDDVIQAGPPADPEKFPVPLYDRGRRARVLVYDPCTGEHHTAYNVLFKDHSTRKTSFFEVDTAKEEALHRVAIAYWKVPDKPPIVTIMGHLEICHVLKPLNIEPDSDSEDDTGAGENCVPNEEIIFRLTEEKVAVKAFSWEKTRRLRGKFAEDPMNEIAAMQLLGNNHPHVLGCHDVLFDGVFLNAVLPYCSSGDLHDRLNLFRKLHPGKRGFPEEEARYWFKQLLKGIQYLQENGVCHRDLSPENIMIDTETRSLVIDMGEHNKDFTFTSF